MPDIEQHHLLGEANSDETVPIDANMHRALSRDMLLWIEPLRTNPNDNPLITIAQELRARGDIDRRLAERGEPFNEWVIARCERASDLLLMINDLLINHQHMLGNAGGIQAAPLPIDKHQPPTEDMVIWLEPPSKSNPDNNPLIMMTWELWQRADIDRYLASHGAPVNEWFRVRCRRSIDLLLNANDLLIELAGENWHERIAPL